jgi:hypothetical protein
MWSEVPASSQERPQGESRLHITDDPSQRREPVENGRVGPPRGSGFVATGWSAFASAARLDSKSIAA